MALPKNGDFSQLLGTGENPNGMIAQTPNGTERNGGGSDGMTYRYGMADGPRWNDDPTPQPPPLVSVEIAAMTPSLPKNRVAVSSHTRRKPNSED
jgi:hypothetical protein